MDLKTTARDDDKEDLDLDDPLIMMRQGPRDSDTVPAVGMAKVAPASNYAAQFDAERGAWGLVETEPRLDAIPEVQDGALRSKYAIPEVQDGALRSKYFLPAPYAGPVPVALNCWNALPTDDGKPRPSCPDPSDYERPHDDDDEKHDSKNDLDNKGHK